MTKFFSLFFITTFFLFVSNIAYGGVMTGSAYKVDFDSMNFAGNLSTTSIYSLDDTLGEIASGTTTGAIYKNSAGFLQKQDSSVISVSVSSTGITMSPSLGGLTGGYSNGSSEINISTDNPTGYSLYIQSGVSPSLNSSNDNFADFAPSGAVPDFDFSVAPSMSNFGFTVEGSDINSNFKDNGSACGTGSLDAVDKCWNGLSTSQKVIAGSTQSNDLIGAITILKFRAGVGNERVQKNSTYYATTTITIVTN